MARLSEHVDWKGAILQKLERKNIVTVLDFLEGDIEEICNLSEIPYKDVIELRRNILSKYAPKPSKGLDIYTDALVKAAKIPTGIQVLDEILEGGMLTGNIYEVCGLSGDGKTQTCLTITTNTVINLKQAVYYIDTKQDFSAMRLCSILNSKGLEETVSQKLLEEVKVKKVDDIYDLITFLHDLKNILNNLKCRLVIIDSMPVLYTSFIGDQNNIGLDLINHAATLMRQIASNFHIVFLVVNLAMHSFDSEENVKHWEGEVNWMGDIRPALGKSWSHVPSTRLLIQKSSDSDVDVKNICVVKSTDVKTGRKCFVRITNSGIESVI